MPYNNDIFHEILKLIFPSEMKDKRPLFMPSQGVSNTPQESFDDWETFAMESNVEIEYIDNSVIVVNRGSICYGFYYFVGAISLFLDYKKMQHYPDNQIY